MSNRRSISGEIPPTKVGGNLQKNQINQRKEAAPCPS
uniref:Uncharacterized protein n=1 Tax=Dulem virus 34 TaxID=3145752 RepID=A0AAU8B4Y1_9CAUD